MARPASFNKRDNEKKKQSKRLEKQKKKEERKTNNSKGASLEEMFAYVDENGMITSTPPELQKKEEIDLDSIIISTPKKEEEEEVGTRKGIVERFIEQKGYGFIKEYESGNKYFFHISAAPKSIGEGDIVFFDVEQGFRDTNAVNIRYEE
ncbi:cold shock domain-containing protein [Parabacteroides sp. OttesenSCG-928-G07]|nr:cold shock domain-containing protein [Parabacteroides sp. OttesenSCG-928-G21]MDL2278271.1 cold shock domain-containing protein [Parabacteroides sp. OttesenSCG-928-G07]